MAIYHLHVQTLSRGEARSFVSALAYRWALKLHDERLGLTVDFRRRRGVMATGIVGFDGQAGLLANACEAAERRRDARVGREIVGALPAELGDAARTAIVSSFAESIHRRHGVAVMWAVHAPDNNGDHRNWHAHLLLTTRKMQNGILAEKTRELDDPAQSGVHVEAFRIDWENLVNAELARAGVNARIDRRSLVDRGEERAPAEHLGPHASKLERQRPFSTTRGARNAASKTEAEEWVKVDAQLTRIEQQLARIDPGRAARDDAHDVRVISETCALRPRHGHQRSDRAIRPKRQAQRCKSLASLRRRRGAAAVRLLLRLVERVPGPWRTVLDTWRVLFDLSPPVKRMDLIPGLLPAPERRVDRDR